MPLLWTTGTGLSQQPSRSRTLPRSRRAGGAAAPCIDLDYRRDVLDVRRTRRAAGTARRSRTRPSRSATARRWRSRSARARAGRCRRARCSTSGLELAVVKLGRRRRARCHRASESVVVPAAAGRGRQRPRRRRRVRRRALPRPALGLGRSSARSASRTPPARSSPGGSAAPTTCPPRRRSRPCARPDQDRARPRAHGADRAAGSTRPRRAMSRCACSAPGSAAPTCTSRRASTPPSSPVTVGHEVCGEVAEVGEGVDGGWAGRARRQRDLLLDLRALRVLPRGPHEPLPRAPLDRHARRRRLRAAARRPGDEPAPHPRLARRATSPR